MRESPVLSGFRTALSAGYLVVRSSILLSGSAELQHWRGFGDYLPMHRASKSPRIRVHPATIEASMDLGLCR